MTISEIKTALSISSVLGYYGLKADKNHRLACPFHQDNTPSMQVYYKTQTAYCFSTNCLTHGKSMDVIDFVMHREKLTKAQAIQKCKEILGYRTPDSTERTRVDLSREQFLGSMFQYFKNAVSSSKSAKDYLYQRKLDYKKIEVGYNGGQFHHGERKDETLIRRCLEYGLLLDKGITSRTGEKAYSTFGKWGICFALRNQKNEVTGLYFRSTLPPQENKLPAGAPRHFYLKNRSGLYPHYPEVNTKKLVLTESIIDGASLLAIDELKKEYSLLACYGTNGLTAEHTQAISQLKQLEELIFAFDNDPAGKQAVLKYAELFKTEYPKLKITELNLPNKDVNETLQGHEPAVFIKLLDQRKEVNFSFSNEEQQPNKPPAKRKNILKHLNEQIGTSGIVGEEHSRMLLFLISLSYLNKQPLHALVQGSSGSGKTHLISKIADLMPPEDVLRFTRITESSLYNWGEYELYGKVMVIEDLDGLKEDALYALREFISNQVLRSSVTIKDKKGNNKSAHKIVKGQFCSMSATTKGETYEDNMSRSFLIAVDESQVQTTAIIHYQNRRNAGELDLDIEQKSVQIIREFVRNLKPYPVVNPYATQLHLPEKVHKIRRLNEMYQSVIKQVTFLNQSQRHTTKDNQLITEIEDITQATEILFESIVLKVDELDGGLRQFFERLKKHVKDDNQDFILRDIRQDFNMSKTQLFRYIQTLLELEYIKQTGGYSNKGIKYTISYRDNYQKLRVEIKDYLMNQIENLKNR